MRVEIGYKQNLKSERQPPDCDWLTLPNFRMDQSAPAQAFLETAKGLKAGGYKLHGHPLVDLRKRPKVKVVEDFEIFLLSITEGYRELIDSWDVTNECANYGADRWGDYWQATVFEIMRRLCPGAQLYLNEYAIQNTEYWDGVLALARRLKSDGLIDGVGIQCRMDVRERVPSGWDFGTALLVRPLPTPRLANAIAQVREMGLLCHLSEVECIYNDGQEQTANAVIDRYERTAREQGVERFTYWSDAGVLFNNG